MRSQWLTCFVDLSLPAFFKNFIDILNVVVIESLYSLSYGVLKLLAQEDSWLVFLFG